jgi:hypothetical protein
MVKLITIHIRRPNALAATGIGGDDKWWKGLTKEQQKAYIKAHPNSKYAHNAKKALVEQKKDTTKKSASVDAPSIKSVFGDKVKALPEEHKEFFENEGDKPGSKERKNIANHIRTNKHEIIKHIKGQFKEWGDGCGAIGKLATGKSISDHEKKLLRL